ncbi:MAG: IPT/TIG domain-containing protein [Deltaproteobacteria bacterium]
MKEIVILLAFLSITSFACAADKPCIYFSDLTSGPNYGGKDNNGVFITIRGTHFGSERGKGSVSIGGAQAASCLSWSDSRIVFQPGRKARSGAIQVHTDRGDSNKLGFQVRPGRILFVSASSPGEPGRGTFADPWRSPASYYRSMRPGDTCYIRKGVYRGVYGSIRAHANVGIGDEAPTASSGREIVWAAYPGEEAVFEAKSDAANGCFEWISPKDHYVISGLTLKGTGRGSVIVSGRHNRIVNNICEGGMEFSYAMIHVTQAVFADILGNTLKGMATGNKLSHPVYVGGGARNIDIGWNVIGAGDIGAGPLVLVNQDGAREKRIVFADILIHDNLIDGAGRSGGNARGIGLAEQAHGSRASVYNNIIVNCSIALYAISGSVEFEHNTVSGCAGPSAVHIYSSHGSTPEQVMISSNILSVKPGCRYITVDAGSGAGIGSNVYSGNGSGPETDARAVNADPCFVDEKNNDFRLRGSRPAAGAGWREACGR